MEENIITQHRPERLRHDGDQCAQLGDQAAEDQEDGTGGQCAAVDDLGHGNQAHVLAEGGVGQNAEAGGKGRAQAVADNTAGQLLIGGLTAHAALHHAGDIAHGLHSGDDEHDQHGQDSAHIKNDLDGNQLGDGKPVGLCTLLQFSTHALVNSTPSAVTPVVGRTKPMMKAAR